MFGMVTSFKPYKQTCVECCNTIKLTFKQTMLKLMFLLTTINTNNKKYSHNNIVFDALSEVSRCAK